MCYKRPARIYTYRNFDFTSSIKEIIAALTKAAPHGLLTNHPHPYLFHSALSDTNVALDTP